MTKQIKLVQCIFFGAYFFAPTLLFATSEKLINQNPAITFQTRESSNPRSVTDRDAITAEISNQLDEHTIAAQKMFKNRLLTETPLSDPVLAMIAKPFNNQKVTLVTLGNDDDSDVNELVFGIGQKVLTTHVLTLGKLSSQDGKTYSDFVDSRIGNTFQCDEDFIEMNFKFRERLEGLQAFANNRLALELEQLLESVKSYNDPNTPLSEILKYLPGVFDEVIVLSENLAKEVKKSLDVTLHVLNEFVQDCDRYIQMRQDERLGIPNVHPEVVAKVKVEGVNITDLSVMAKSISSITRAIIQGNYPLNELTRFLRSVECGSNDEKKEHASYNELIKKYAEPFKKYTFLFKEMPKLFDIKKDDERFERLRIGINLIEDSLLYIQEYLTAVNVIMKGEAAKKEQNRIQESEELGRASSQNKDKKEIQILQSRVSASGENHTNNLESIIRQGSATASELRGKQTKYATLIEQAKDYLGLEYNKKIWPGRDRPTPEQK